MKLLRAALWACLLTGALVAGAAARDSDAEVTMSEIAEPGPMHQHLKLLVGDWRQEFEIVAPDGATLRGTASTRNRMVFGGRFLEITGDVEFMGQTGEGVLYIGHDNLKGAYTFYNMTSVSTDVTFAEGTWDEAARRFTFHGRNVDPVSRRERSFRIEITLLDEDTFQQENFFQAAGQEELKGVRAISHRVPRVP